MWHRTWPPNNLPNHLGPMHLLILVYQAGRLLNVLQKSPNRLWWNVSTGAISLVTVFWRRCSKVIQWPSTGEEKNVMNRITWALEGSWVAFKFANYPCLGNFFCRTTRIHPSCWAEVQDGAVFLREVNWNLGLWATRFTMNGFCSTPQRFNIDTHHDSNTWSCIQFLSWISWGCIKSWPPTQTSNFSPKMSPFLDLFGCLLLPIQQIFPLAQPVRKTSSRRIRKTFFQKRWDLKDFWKLGSFLFWFLERQSFSFSIFFSTVCFFFVNQPTNQPTQKRSKCSLDILFDVLWFSTNPTEQSKGCLFCFPQKVLFGNNVWQGDVLKPCHGVIFVQAKCIAMEALFVFSCINMYFKLKTCYVLWQAIRLKVQQFWAFWESRW